jgi:peptidoglycan hydrolase-like protein with peptidoglycan-binding domain
VGTYTRTRILLREGRIIKRLKPDIIANTGVNGTAFSGVIQSLENAELLASSEDMVMLQTELQSRGLYIGSLDGQLGRGTRNAILRFEDSQGLPPTGLPTKTLLRKLSEERVKPSHTLSTSTARGTAEPRPTSTTRSRATISDF